MTISEQRYTMIINTTPEKLWQAITNPEFCRQYWGGHANISDWKVGSTWQHVDTNNGDTVRIKGKVLENLPSKRLVISWLSPNNENDSSKVTFEIQPVQGLVRLDVIHNEFKSDSAMSSGVAKGWPVVLSSLKTYLETGKPIDVMAVLGDSACGNKTAA